MNREKAHKYTLRQLLSILCHYIGNKLAKKESVLPIEFVNTDELVEELSERHNCFAIFYGNWEGTNDDAINVKLSITAQHKDVFIRYVGDIISEYNTED